MKASALREGGNMAFHRRGGRRSDGPDEATKGSILGPQTAYASRKPSRKLRRGKKKAAPSVEGAAFEGIADPYAWGAGAASAGALLPSRSFIAARRERRTLPVFSSIPMTFTWIMSPILT